MNPCVSGCLVQTQLRVIQKHKKEPDFQALCSQYGEKDRTIRRNQNTDSLVPM